MREQITKLTDAEAITKWVSSQLNFTIMAFTIFLNFSMLSSYVFDFICWNHLVGTFVIGNCYRIFTTLLSLYRCAFDRGCTLVGRVLRRLSRRYLHCAKRRPRRSLSFHKPVSTRKCIIVWTMYNQIKLQSNIKGKRSVNPAAIWSVRLRRLGESSNQAEERYICILLCKYRVHKP